MDKIVINLLSKETIPNFLAIREFEPQIVVSFVTDEFEDQISLFSRITKAEHQKVSVKAYNVDMVLNAVKNIAENYKEGTKLILNFTGGTKVMSAAMVLQGLLIGKNVELIYVNSALEQIEHVWLNEENQLITKSSLIQTKLSIKDNIALKGEQLKYVEESLSEHANERLELSEELALNSAFTGVFNKQGRFFENKNLKPEAFLKLRGNVEIGYTPNQLYAYTNQGEFEFPHPDGGRYLTGEWLEEFTFNELKKSNYFDYVGKGLKLDFKNFILQQKSFDKNELDVVVSKGLKSAIIECKAGKVTQEHVYKLDAIRNYLLGPFGKAMFVCRFTPPPNIIEKCKDLNIALCANSHLKNITGKTIKLLK